MNEHHPNCDINDSNPDGIKKPCNCKTALSELGQKRLEDIRSNLSTLEESLNTRAQVAEKIDGVLYISEQEAWQILDIIGFVQTLPTHLEGDQA